MPGLYTEADYENSVIELFRNDLGYEYAYGPDIERDFYSPLYEEVLLDSLYRLNRGLPDDAIQDALFKLKNFENGELVQKNAVFMDYLQNGIPVRFFVGGEERSSIVYLVDYKNPDNNSFIVANQWTFIENSNKRPDVILFLNGLPVVLVELKSPSREETDASEAYRQLRNYMQEIPSMFIYNAICVMSGHNLMQAIARVNRVFRDKEGGLVVDYVGIATALKQAMNDYTSRDKKNYGDTDVAKVAYPKFLEKLSVCRDKFHGYDYSKFQNGTDLERAKTISGAVNFIMGREKVDEKDSFVKEALMLHQALSLCSSLAPEDSRFEAAFFESVRVLVLRLTNTGVGKKISLPEMNARINELLKQSIKSDGVINLFSDIKEEFSLFDPKFLQEVANMKEKNLAVELLKKLIAEQVSVYRRTNVVKSEKFSEIMQRSLNAYLNGMLTNEEVIEEMLKLAKQIAAAQKEGDKLGLTADELAFYDALTKPQAIKDFYENDELIAITKELADTLRKNKTIDWQKRESARAKMRMLIKKLLKKHKYPPEGMEDAVQTVMTQCELWTDNMEM